MMFTKRGRLRNSFFFWRARVADPWGDVTGARCDGRVSMPPAGGRWSRRRIGCCFADTPRRGGSAELGDAPPSLQLLHIFIALAIEADGFSTESFILRNGRPPSARLLHAFESRAVKPKEVASQRWMFKRGRHPCAQRLLTSKTDARGTRERESDILMTIGLPSGQPSGTFTPPD